MPACHDNFLPREKRGGIFPELRWSMRWMMRGVRNIGASVTSFDSGTWVRQPIGRGGRGAGYHIGFCRCHLARRSHAG